MAKPTFLNNYPAFLKSTVSTFGYGDALISFIMQNKINVFTIIEVYISVWIYSTERVSNFAKLNE
jgi:hypothetical protein